MLSHLNGYVRYAYFNNRVKPVYSMHILGNEWTAKIMKSLRDRDMTASQLSKSLYIAHTSIGRLLHKLEEEQLILSYSKGGKRYYHINFDYILVAKSKIIQYLDSFPKPVK